MVWENMIGVLGPILLTLLVREGISISKAPLPLVLLDRELLGVGGALPRLLLFDKFFLLEILLRRECREEKLSSFPWLEPPDDVVVDASSRALQDLLNS